MGNCQSEAASKSLEFAEGKLCLKIAPIAVLEFCQPDKRNAVTMRMWEELPRVLDRVAGDPGIRVLLVRGSGLSAFCAGADISEFEVMYGTPESTDSYIKAVRHAQFQLRHLPQPTVAWVYGDCVGSGCGLALACDLRFAAADARFGIPPAKLGLAYSVGDTAQLVEKVGPARAKDLLFSARLIDTAEALAIGLVDRSIATDQLAAEVMSYATSMADLSQISNQVSKKIINSISDMMIPDNAELDALYVSTFSGADMREGYEAFLQRRKPVFRNQGQS